jgi:hypothetical protein
MMVSKLLLAHEIKLLMVVVLVLLVLLDNMVLKDGLLQCWMHLIEPWHVCAPIIHYLILVSKSNGYVLSK